MGRRHSSKKTDRGSNSDTHHELDREVLASVKPSPPVGRYSQPPARIRSFVEDRRRWAPRFAGEPQREQPRELVGRPARHTIRPQSSPKVRRGPGGKPLRSAPKYFGARMREVSLFETPRRVIICLKRKMRREVLFATRRTRAGAGSPKRRNEWSDFQC